MIILDTQVVFYTRAYPSKTELKLLDVQGTGFAFIGEVPPDKSEIQENLPPEFQGVAWAKLDLELEGIKDKKDREKKLMEKLEKLARAGDVFFYKTSTFAGNVEIYTPDMEHVRRNQIRITEKELLEETV